MVEAQPNEDSAMGSESTTSSIYPSNIKADYKVESVIGKGSFASVRKGRSRTTGDRVAIKVIAKRKLTEEDKVGLQNEIDILKEVDHPNIVKLFDIYEDDKYFFLVMELMMGGELFDQILQRERFNEAEARDIVAPIFDALNYCHQLGIIHRDIKPENLLFSSRDFASGIIKVSDFGLARFIDDEKLATTTCGTPGYVAPEILEQRPYGASCDFWSVGIVLFILLSGTPPFYDEDNFALFEKIKRCQYNFDAPSWATISPEAKDFISKILVANPETRLNGQQIMNHPWILGQSLPTNTDQNILHKMRNWNSGRIRHVQPAQPDPDDGDDNMANEQMEEDME